MGEGVIAAESSFDARKGARPGCEVSGGGLEGDSELLSRRAYIGDDGGGPGVCQLVVDFPGDVAFEAAHDLLFGLAFFGAPGNLVFRSLVAGHAGNDHVVDGGVGCSVAAVAEPVPGGLRVVHKILLAKNQKVLVDHTALPAQAKVPVWHTNFRQISTSV